MKSERELQLERLLQRFMEPIKGIPFEIVIQSLCGVAVTEFDRDDPANQNFLIKIADALTEVCDLIKKTPIERPRPNEVGNDIEPFVVSALKGQGLDAACPKTKSGAGKSTGYPDIRLKVGDSIIFLEIKTYNRANHSTTQRSFYLSPSTNPKVHEDGIHLLAAFEVVREGNHFWPVAYEVVDLYGLDCDMKAEFNSDNKRLYEEKRVLVKRRIEDI